MLNTDERKTALRNIESVVPSTVFNYLINILTTIEDWKNDAIVEALSRASTNPAYSFYYRAGSKKDTPISEILDLCEGWFITSNSIEQGEWRVESLIGKEVPE